jgi:hypothetical protein
MFLFNLSTTMPSLEIFRALEIHLSYFASLNLFGNWKIFKQLEKGKWVWPIGAVPAHPVKPARGRLAQGPLGKIPNARLALRPTAPPPIDHRRATVPTSSRRHRGFHRPRLRAAHVCCTPSLSSPTWASQGTTPLFLSCPPHSSAFRAREAAVERRCSSRHHHARESQQVNDLGAAFALPSPS